MSGRVIHLSLHDLREGDAVRLRSGGPIMLVAIADAEARRTVHCIWTSGRRLETDWFEPAALEVVARGSA